MNKLYCGYMLMVCTLTALYMPVGTNASGRSPIAVMPPPATYFYGYDNSLLIAMVTNARQNQVAYTSFESGEKGFWSYSGAESGGLQDQGRTGIKYYSLGNGAVQRTGLVDGKYMITFWARGGTVTVSGTNYTLVSQNNNITISGWTLHQYVIQLSAAGSDIQLAGSAQIDELRLHPFASQMVTYTYDPAAGKTSETDINNNTTYYEYDEFNRITCVKDQYGNIRQSFIYHLKNQL